VIEDVEVTLNALREELHLYARSAARWSARCAGRQRRRDRLLADGLGGYSIPSIVEPEIIQFEVQGQVHPACRKRHGLAAVQRRQVLEEAQLHPHARRRPAAARRAAAAHRLHNELKLPVYCLLDNDPWGYYIYSVIKQGSINLAYESQRMAIPDAKLPRAAEHRLRTLRPLAQREDQPERHRPQAGQADRQVSLVREQEALAERNQK
jgi:DNA topoisomerase VI subunit A